jgi:hypothetical protein
MARMGLGWLWDILGGTLSLITIHHVQRFPVLAAEFG